MHDPRGVAEGTKPTRAQYASAASRCHPFLRAEIELFAMLDQPRQIPVHPRFGLALAEPVGLETREIVRGP
jgi:hypothetical protein